MKRMLQTIPAELYIALIGFISVATSFAFMGHTLKHEHDDEKNKLFTVTQDGVKYQNLKIRYNTASNGHFVNKDGKAVSFKGSYIITEE